jgi:hypothetical protein
MKKPFSLANISFFCLIAVLVFIGVKLQKIDQKLMLITKPAKKFAINQIINEFPHNPDWDITCPPETVEFVNMITQQPFYYLGRGFQATAFESQDGDYVIKFFHQSRLRKKPFSEDPFRYIFSSEFRKDMENRESHKDEIFTSSKMAYEQFPEEAGILYVHLNRTHDLIKGIKLFDPLRQSYRFRGDDASFIIQKKAMYVLPTLKALMQQGSLAEAQKRIDHIFDLLLSLANKGFVDSDMALMRNNNVGFTKDRAIYIDTGHITKKANLDVVERMRFEFDVRVAPLYDWLKIRYPELASYYQEKRSQMLATLEQTHPNSAKQ